MLGHQVVGPSELIGSWTFEPVLLATLVLAGLLYERGQARLGRRIAQSDGRGRALAFYGGLVVLAAALTSPLDPLASTLFSAHMVQHLLLMMVAAPLLAYARPTAAIVAGLPAGGRQAARGARGPRWRASASAMVNPLVVWTAGTLVLWSWHMPSVYEAALSHDALHVVEHASFLAAALLFWSVVIRSGTRRGLPRPIATLLVFASGVQGAALGAILVFASTALYPVHGAGARAWDMSPVADQQLAGALMWGPPALLYVGVMGWLLYRWFAEMEDAAPSPSLVASGEHP